METIKSIKSGDFLHKNKNLNLYLLGGVGLVALLLAFFLFDSESGIDTKELRYSIVKYGDVVREVKAPGKFIPKNSYLISSQVTGIVKERLLEPGAVVTEDSVIAKLQAPDTERDYQNALAELKIAEISFDLLIEKHKSERIEKKAEVELLQLELSQAQHDLAAKKSMREKKLINERDYNEAILRLERLTRTLQLEQYRLSNLPLQQERFERLEQSKLAQQRVAVVSLQGMVDSLNVKAGASGILQNISIDVGQEVTKGQELAQVADQDNLVAELKVQEGQIREVAVGKAVRIDTRRNVINGFVSRINPAVVEGTVKVEVVISGKLPEEARPDLRIEGTIEVQKAENVLLIGKPENWDRSEKALLFVVSENDVARRVEVELGISSLSEIEILKGLSVNQKVIISDMSDHIGGDSIKLAN